MGVSSLKSAWDTIKDPDISGWEKFSSVTMSLSMGLPMLFTSISSINNAILTGIAIRGTSVALTGQETSGELRAIAVKKIKTDL